MNSIGMRRALGPPGEPVTAERGNTTVKTLCRTFTSIALLVVLGVVFAASAGYAQQ